MQRMKGDLAKLKELVEHVEKAMRLFEELRPYGDDQDVLSWTYTIVDLGEVVHYAKSRLKAHPRFRCKPETKKFVITKELPKHRY